MYFFLGPQATNIVESCDVSSIDRPGSKLKGACFIFHCLNSAQQQARAFGRGTAKGRRS